MTVLFFDYEDNHQRMTAEQCRALTERISDETKVIFIGEQTQKIETTKNESTHT